MFKRGGQARHSAPITLLVILLTVLAVAVRLAGYSALTDVRLSILTGILATLLLADRALARHQGLTLHGAIGWALVASVALAVHDVLAATQGADEGWVPFVLACSLGITALASVAAGVRLVGPLLTTRSTQKAGTTIVLGICLTVGGLLLLSLATTQPGGAARIPLILATAAGLALWGPTLAQVQRTRATAGSWSDDLLLHLSGWGHMAALLFGHLTMIWAPAQVASIAGCGLLACAARSRSESDPQAQAGVRNAQIVAIVAPTLTLLVPAAAWMYLLGREIAWLAAAVATVSIAVTGGLIVLLRLGHGDRTVPKSRVPDPATELCLHFQLIVRVSDGVVVGAESLLREIDGVGGSAPSIVDRLGQDRSHDVVTDFVLTETFRQGASLLGAMGDPDAFVSLNLSAHEIARPDIVDRVQRALEIAGCEPTGFGIELTEQATVDFTDNRLVDRLTTLQNLGFLVILDDFGTGHSNLASLSEFEFDLIKLDRSLLQAATRPRGDRMLRKTVELASESGARVVMEGIDEDRHHDVLRRHQPDFAQGYGFAQPEPVLDVLYALAAPDATPTN